jgi:carbonic anhydrase
LVVIMGHSGCGAVEATIDEVLNPTASLSANLEQVVNRIRPAVNTLLTEEPGISRESLSDRAVKANVALMTRLLIRESDLLKNMVEEGRLAVAGAEYSLETGLVDFFV